MLSKGKTKIELVKTISVLELKKALGVPPEDDLVIDDVQAHGVAFIRVLQIRQVRYVSEDVAKKKTRD